MSIYIWTGAGVVALLAGCAGAAQQDVTPRGPDTPDPFVRCPDPTTDCGGPNGTGIYTAEGGYAGIDEIKLMITHFMNNSDGGPNVTFQGRYFAASNKRWQLLTGSVAAADYAGPSGPQTRLPVLSVAESSTIPTWTLLDRAVQPPATIAVSDADLTRLALHIQFTIPPAAAQEIVLTFTDPDITPNPPTIHRYQMHWSKPNGAARQYCFKTEASVVRIPEDPNDADPIVFQQSIDVDPLNGHVTRTAATADFVTLSCFLGAPATVYSWGYPYKASRRPPRPADHPVHPEPTYYFDAGIQMKRASYCGNEEAYTVAGTQIDVADDWPIRQDPMANLEAMWTPSGASCLNCPNRRHPEMHFSGQCGGHTLPACPPSLPPSYVPPGPRGPDAFLASGSTSPPGPAPGPPCP